MGRTYLFECAKCGYRAELAGGAERGRQLAVQTIHCLNCRELRDVVTEWKRPEPGPTHSPAWKLKPTPFEPACEATPPPSFASAVNSLTVRRGQPFRWARFKLACPVAPWHEIRRWQQPGKCPKCGIFLDGGGTPFKAWD